MAEPAKSYPHIRKQNTDLDPSEVLLIEYQEAGETFRNYERMLHQSYYLSAVVLTFFVGTAVSLLTRPNSPEHLSILIPFIGGVIFTFLAYAGWKYNRRRASASRLRDQIASDLHEISDSNVPRVQKVAVGNGPVWNEKKETWFRNKEKEGVDQGGSWLKFPPLWVLLFTLAVVLFLASIVGFAVKNGGYLI